MALTFYTSMAKGLKLKLRNFWGLSPTFVEVTGEKLVRGASPNLNRVEEVVDAYAIPDDLVININQTPLSFILVSKYTMDKKNEKVVPIANSADYRQVTGTFSITLSGIFLPVQIIYQGLSESCHPKFKFPEEFSIRHSVNHWPNEESDQVN